jgi:hypothetical protein
LQNLKMEKKSIVLFSSSAVSLLLGFILYGVGLYKKSFGTYIAIAGIVLVALGEFLLLYAFYVKSQTSTTNPKNTQTPSQISGITSTWVSG